MKKTTIVLCLILSALCTVALAEKTAYLGQTRPYTVEEFNVPEEADIIEVDESGRAIYYGNTCGMGNDYQFNCEFTYTDLAEDVAYTFVVYTAGQYTFDLCGSSYDTRLGVFDASGNLLCCNDDACGFVPSPPYEDGPFASKIECCDLDEGTYTVVVDGYSEYTPFCGDFVLSITQCFGCEIECPTSVPREPELCDEEINSGCNVSPPAYSLLDCNSEICGTGHAANGTRDVDFYQVTLTQPSFLRWCAIAEFPVVVAILDPTTDCAAANIHDIQAGAACQQVCASTECLPAGTYWVFVAPNSFDNIACSEYYGYLSCTPCGDCQGTEAVYFQPGTGLPPSQCVDLCLNQLLPIYVCPGGSFPPIVTVRPGCFYQEPGCDIECPPAEFFFNPSAWTMDPLTGCWINWVRPLSDGCACISFDGFLPVELLSFGAVAGDARVTLAWETASETNNDHFEILRDGAQIAQITAQGNGAEGHRYAYADNQVENGATYQYVLVAVDVSGARETLGTASATPTEQISIANEYALEQNYPNPFNPSTSIQFALAEAGMVRLTIFNLAGQEVATLVNGSLGAGAHTITFDARDLPSGMYLYRLEAGQFTAARKMMLMK